MPSASDVGAVNAVRVPAIHRTEDTSVLEKAFPTPLNDVAGSPAMHFDRKGIADSFPLSSA